MFKTNSIIALALSAFIGGTAVAAGPGTFKVNPAKANLKWVATKVTGKHEGTVKLASGSLMSDGKNLTGGSFDIDMNSIACTDIEDKETNGKFIGHLKSDDFFSVDKHKTARFIIGKVTPKSGNEVEISGKMTIKGITKDITFPATVTHTGKSINAKAKITIDRSEYDVRFGSGKFFADLGDKIIHDDFIIDLDMEAGA
jgi:polyisoprenoid-binding protein YceI